MVKTDTTTGVATTDFGGRCDIYNRTGGVCLHTSRRSTSEWTERWVRKRQNPMQIAGRIFTCAIYWTAQANATSSHKLIHTGTPQHNVNGEFYIGRVYNNEASKQIHTHANTQKSLSAFKCNIWIVYLQVYFIILRVLKLLLLLLLLNVCDL